MKRISISLPDVDLNYLQAMTAGTDEYLFEKAAGIVGFWIDQHRNFPEVLIAGVNDDHLEIIKKYSGRGASLAEGLRRLLEVASVSLRLYKSLEKIADAVIGDKDIEINLPPIVDNETEGDAGGGGGSAAGIESIADGGPDLEFNVQGFNHLARWLKALTAGQDKQDEINAKLREDFNLAHERLDLARAELNRLDNKIEDLKAGIK